MPRPFTLFTQSSETLIFPYSREESNSVPITLKSVQSKKLRWVTLGGQYNWTTKKYPSFQQNSVGCPLFPQSLAQLLSGRGALFEGLIKPEASIINFYSEGDILSPHQDVAEMSSADLVSISIGCEAIFFCGLSKSEPPLQIRLRSGDVLVMGGKSRFAWHGVGKIWDKTSPDLLQKDYATSFDSTGVDPKTLEGRESYAEWISIKCKISTYLIILLWNKFVHYHRHLSSTFHWILEYLISFALWR
ncbi:2OG-Fe(II) oxygenase superfamily-domain-containing protein [Dipodascopsis uninucleata]